MISPKRNSKATTSSGFFLVEKIKFLLLEKTWIVFILILIIGMYLRFYDFQNVIGFGWDQGRDAQMVRNILSGKLTLIGPRTGVGHMHLGPVYYYILAPFYYFTNLDPVGSDYLNILMNIINFVIIFIVTKKLFGKYNALFVTLIYSISSYLINVNQVPWNVTLMPGLAVLIFYAITQIYEQKYKWVFILWTLSGFFFNIHFTAIFIPFINIASLIFVKEKRKVFLYSLMSIPLYVIWFVPNIIYQSQANGDTQLYKDFIHYYYIGFHFRFLMYRLPQSLVQFRSILNIPQLYFLQYLLPIIFIVLLYFEKNVKQKLYGYITMLWFIIPLIGFTLYGGPLSDYYFLYNAPMVLFILAYLQKKLLTLKYKSLILTLLVIFWLFYAYINTKSLWIKPSDGGLNGQKQYVQTVIANSKSKLFKKTIAKFKKYNEGDTDAYLYSIYTQKK